MSSFPSPTHPVLFTLLQSVGVTIDTAPDHTAGAAIQVGFAAALPCWLVAPADVRATAIRLSRRAQCGIVVACDPDGTCLTLATTMMPVRVATVVVARGLPRVLARLSQVISTPPATAMEQLVACTSALDTDSAGRETFRLLRTLLDRATALLPATVPLDDRQEWALLQVTRLLFLRFVESEGWLDGRHQFLREELDRCLHARRDPGTQLLHPLFFGTLNRPAQQRSRLARSFGSVPFLNGGLFEPHHVERRHHLSLPGEFWCDAFAALVERIDVTLDHSHDARLVTPEMLGTVFEGMMRPAERRAAGAFYTPPALVGGLVRAAVVSHLAMRLGRTEQAVDQAIADPDPELQRAMLNTTVLDPAVGSGAFLVGSLALLHGPGPRDGGRVRHLVTRRLYGVDRHPGAVRLCEMRLWLEVLRAMRGQPPEQLRPLPNLDTTIRAGDIIADPLMMQRVTLGIVRSLRTRQRQVVTSHDGTRRLALRRLRDAERGALVTALDQRERVIERAIRELVAASSSQNLFGRREELRPAQRIHLEQLRSERQEVRRERRRAQRDTITPAFSLQTAFAPIMTGRKGFDLVIGNPPWVRGQHLPPATRELLAARYRWCRAAGGGGWAQLPDLCVAFLERGFDSLAPSGTMAMLVPSKLVTVGYAARGRAALVHQSTLHVVADLTDDPRAGFDATTYPLAIVASRQTAPRRHSVRIGLPVDAPAIRQSEWRAAASWSTAPPPAQRLLHRLAGDHPPVGASVRPQLGVKTGLNAAFIDPPDALRTWCVEVLRGSDVAAFAIHRRHLMLWPADPTGTPWDHLPPPVAAHLMPFSAALRTRSDCTGSRWWMLFRTVAATAPHRVAWSDIARGLGAVALGPGSPIPLNSCYVAPTPDGRAAHALTAWLNSTWIRALATVNAESAANAYLRFGARVVGSLPMPPCVLRSDELATLGHAAASSTPIDVMPSIDAAVGRLLKLNDADCAVLAPLAAHRR